MTAGAACSRLVPMSGRKNLLAQGTCTGTGDAGAAGGAGGSANAATVKVNAATAVAKHRFACRITRASKSQCTHAISEGKGRVLWRREPARLPAPAHVL